MQPRGPVMMEHRLIERMIALMDKIFFPAAMNCLSVAEQKAMLDEFYEFDRSMIHAKYKSVVDALER